MEQRLPQEIFSPTQSESFLFNLYLFTFKSTAFASALGKALRPTAKHSHGSCLSACKTIRSSTHRKISHSDVLPEEDSVAASTAAETITKHQPNVSMKIAKSCAKDLKNSINRVPGYSTLNLYSGKRRSKNTVNITS